MSEALRLADWLDAHSNGPLDNKHNAAAELRRLHQHELAYKEWLDKTEWVQETSEARELGMHRVDVLKRRIDRLHALNAELVEALTTCVMAMQDYQAGIGITEMFDKGERMARAALAKAPGETK